MSGVAPGTHFQRVACLAPGLCRRLPCSVFFLLPLLIALLLLTATVQAAEISVRNPQLTASDEGYQLSADFSIVFNRRLEEVVNKGVVLYFVADFELFRPRWYWLDEQIVSRSRTFQLSYHALTRQYRLSTGLLHQSFYTLDEAVRVMSQLRNWQVLDKDEVRHGLRYQASLRLRLDISQMPKTFQVSALSSRDWNLVSDWQHWSFPPGNPKAADAEADSGTSREGGHLPGLKVAPALVTPPLSPAAVESAP